MLTPVIQIDQITQDPNTWIASAPFRAHVTHLMQKAQVPWPIIAYQAGVPQSTVRTLLYGRDGKHRPKIVQSSAVRLLELRPEDLTWMRISQVSAEHTGTRIRCLRTLNVPWDNISNFLTLDEETCQALARGERTSCSVMVDILAQCACAQAGVESWDDLDEQDSL